MRRPRRPTRRELVGAVAFGTFILLAGLLTGAGVAASVGSALVVIAVILIWPDDDEPGEDLCGKCAHLRRDHHGPCQQCLRDVASRSVDARKVPCSRFVRRG